MIFPAREEERKEFLVLGGQRPIYRKKKEMTPPGRHFSLSNNRIEDLCAVFGAFF